MVVGRVSVEYAQAPRHPATGGDSMSLQPKPILSLDDWLEGERAVLEGRSEYLDGEVFAMTGASGAQRHRHEHRQ